MSEEINIKIKFINCEKLFEINNDLIKTNISKSHFPSRKMKYSLKKQDKNLEHL